MATIPAHALVGAVTGLVAPVPPGLRRRFVVLGAVCAVVPDLDVVGFAFGVRYGDLLGHRGLFHSLPFAIFLGCLVASVSLPRGRRRWGGALVLATATASHGLLDGMTDGGLGVAYLAPFEAGRAFLPWRPLVVPPIGLANFRGEWARRVIASEAIWVGLPCVAVTAAALLARWGRGRLRRRPRPRGSDASR